MHGGGLTPQDLTTVTQHYTPSASVLVGFNAGRKAESEAEKDIIGSSVDVDTQESSTAGDTSGVLGFLSGAGQCHHSVGVINSWKFVDYSPSLSLIIGFESSSI